LVSPLMSLLSIFAKRFSSATLTVAAGLLLVGCQGPSPLKEAPRVIGTFPMGERVQVGSLIYTVLEANYKSQLVDDPAASAPKNRFLLIKMTITNAGKDDAPIPQMVLVNGAGENIHELNEIKEELPGWFGGILRRMKAAQTETGTIAFDVPLAAYKLRVTDGGDIDNERYAFIEIPVQIQ